jgi:hypothetical protein
MDHAAKKEKDYWLLFNNKNRRIRVPQITKFRQLEELCFGIYKLVTEVEKREKVASPSESSDELEELRQLKRELYGMDSEEWSD